MYIILINVSSTRIYPETPSTVECQVLLDSSRVTNDFLFLQYQDCWILASFLAGKLHKKTVPCC